MMFFDYTPTQTPTLGPRWVSQGDKRGLTCEYCETWYEADETSPGYSVALRTIICYGCRSQDRRSK